MEILTVKNNKKIQQGTAIALGNFDGLHLGHQHLIKTMISESIKNKFISSVLLFNNHTRSIINEYREPKIITTNDQKINILDSLGVEIIYTMNFDKEVMKLSPKEFVVDILVEKLKVKLVVVGFDYRFGYKAKGDIKYLRKLGLKYGFRVIVIDPVYDNNQIISSTIIRKLIKSGNIKDANNLLYRPYTIQGKVVRGKSRGKNMGYPTANLELYANYLIPKFGVYKTITIVNNIEYNSLTNIGNNPTFDNKSFSIESHILDFNKNIYDYKISLKFIKYLRKDIKFNTKYELVDQIKKDIKSIEDDVNIYNSTCL